MDRPSQLHLLPLLLLLLYSVSQRPVLATDQPQCRDTNGDPLDWFVMLKQPDSAEFAYISASSPDKWIQPGGANLSSNGPVAATLSRAFATASLQTIDVLAAYNDERPPLRSGPSTKWWATTTGHMKGVVVLTVGQQGFWLIHSVPKFPSLDLPFKYTYPHTGLKYGQSFLCITVNSSDMAEAIGKQLLTSHPDLYNISVSSAALAKWPSWADLQKKRPPPAQVLNSTVKLLTSGGLPLVHVAKSPKLTKDLYDYLLTEQLDSNIQVESWQHGPHLLNSTCSRRYNVTKVLRVRIADKENFTSTEDHSKWCVSTSSGRPYVCIGDMNRAQSQFKRGGGIACMALAGPHRLFGQAVLGDQPCRSVERMRRIGSAENVQVTAMFTWVMVATLCAVACTAISALLLLLVVIDRVRGNRSSSGSRYQSL